MFSPHSSAPSSMRCGRGRITRWVRAFIDEVWNRTDKALGLLFS